MNYLLLTLFLVHIVSGDCAQNALEQDLLAIFEMWMKGNMESFPLKFPSVDLIKVPKCKGTYEESGIKLKYSINEMNLTGVPMSYLSDLTASETMLTARGVLVSPLLTLTSKKYQLNGSAYYFFPIKGTGNMTVTFQNVILLFDLQLGTDGTGTRVDSLKFGLDIDKILVQLTGISSLINSSINKEALGIFNTYRQKITDGLRAVSISFLDSYLNNTTPEELLQIIASIRPSINRV